MRGSSDVTDRSGEFDASALRALLDDPECPFGRDAGDIVSALREGRQPAQTRWIHQSELVRFITERTGEAPSTERLDELMLGEIGARHISVIDLDHLTRRVLRRLVGRPAPAAPMYEVPRRG